MDPSLRKDKESFTKRALASLAPTAKAQKSKEAAAKVRVSVQPSQKKTKRKRISDDVDRTKSTAPTAHKSNNPQRILKSVIDKMKERYLAKNYDKASLDEILVEIDRTDLKLDMKLQIRDALVSNSKIQFYPEEDNFLFKPALGHNVCNKRQLLARLWENESKGLGGIPISDIREAVHNTDRVIKRLTEDDLIIRIKRKDNEEVIFYNNPDFSLKQPACEKFKALWHSVSVVGMTDADIEKYLENVGLGAMQGEGRKRKAPGNSHKKTRKKPKQSKVMNVHLDNELLKDYSADADKS